MPYELQNKVALVTGGGRGIGAQIVRTILEEGAMHVAFLDVVEDLGTALQKELQAKYGTKKVKFYKCDVSVDEQLFGCYQSVLDEHGYIDVVINNAGIINESPNAYKKEIEINLTALVTSSLKAYELMRKDRFGKGGTIINIGSIGAFVASPFMPIYCCTKSAVVHFSTTIGSELIYSRSGVRVLVMNYGSTDTPILDYTKTFDPAFQNEFEDFVKQNALQLQSTESAARALVDAYRNGASGSVWLSGHDQPGIDATDLYTKSCNSFMELLTPKNKK